MKNASKIQKRMHAHLSRFLKRVSSKNTNYDVVLNWSYVGQLFEGLAPCDQQGSRRGERELPEKQAQPSHLARHAVTEVLELSPSKLHNSEVRFLFGIRQMCVFRLLFQEL